MPTREELRQAKETLRAVEQELGTAKAQAAAARDGWGERMPSIEEFGIVPSGFARQLADTEREGLALKAEIERLQEQGAKLSALRESAAKLDDRLAAAQAEKDAAAARAQALTVERTAKQSVLELELERIPEELRSPERFEARLRQQRESVRELEAEWKAAQDGLTAAQLRAAEEKANAAQLGKRLEEATAAGRQAAERFAEERQREGFATPEQYARAKMSREDRESLRASTEAFRAELAAVSAQLGELERELEGRERADGSAAGSARCDAAGAGARAGGAAVRAAARGNGGEAAWRDRSGERALRRDGIRAGADSGFVPDAEGRQFAQAFVRAVHF
ncbi:hypothetical protein [Cohnella algarum]|uniref:hypothetical protein n=1 Tax=Cohnella algarum TaxID=2044859 RepID=UPI001F087C99|nr:hypothetical protein [Cohnella algarum]